MLSIYFTLVLLRIYDINNRFTHLTFSLQLYPCKIPDLSSECPLVISGRYDGSFPDSIKVSGTLADMSNFIVELKVQRAKDMPLNRVIFEQLVYNLLSCERR